MPNEFAVEMQDVVKKFATPEGGILAAVNHVTMQIKDGEFFSLLGPSGCGKTTSLRMIAWWRGDAGQRGDYYRGNFSAHDVSESVHAYDHHWRQCTGVRSRHRDHQRDPAR